MTEYGHKAKHPYDAQKVHLVRPRKDVSDLFVSYCRLQRWTFFNKAIFTTKPEKVTCKRCIAVMPKDL